jgi:hypothetical protein
MSAVFTIGHSSVTVKNSVINYFYREIGCSTCNEYIPFYSLFFSTTTNSNDSIIYFKNLLECFTTIEHKTYNNLISGLKFMSNTRDVSNLSGVKLVTNLGTLFDSNDKILLCLAINSKYAKSIYNSGIPTRNIDTKKLRLYVSTDFMVNKDYNKVRKHIIDKYINHLRELKIDIIEVHDIEERLFNINYKLPLFKDVQEMNNFIHQKIDETFNKDDRQ